MYRDTSIGICRHYCCLRLFVREVRRDMSEKISSPQTQNPLEQYILLAKSAKGAAAVAIIKQVLEAPGLYVFGELLSIPNIQELSQGQYEQHYNLLKLFAYGTFTDYKANKSSLPDLTGAQMQKLRHLTIVSLATKSKCIPYTVLLQDLDLPNLRELEDLIIEVIYADIIRGKLDQKNNQLEVDYAIGRDIGPEDINGVVTVLQEWCDSCEVILSNIETQINKANSCKESRTKHKALLDQEVSNIKKTLKTQVQDVDEQMGSNAREASVQGEKLSKKPSKNKGLRGSGKFWQKS